MNRPTDLPRFTVVAAVNDERVLHDNLLRSPDLQAESPHQLLTETGHGSASLAYNQALDKAEYDLLVFVHQDVYLPGGWFDKLAKSIEALEGAGQRWGVLGSFGSTRVAKGGLGQVYTTGLGVHGNPIAGPSPVETLDEIVLVLRRSSGLRFDPDLPHFHLYGADICLAAREAGRGVFAIPAFCVHNTNQLPRLPAEFYRCYWYTKRKWKRYLPIDTACLTISAFDLQLRCKRITETLDRWRGRGRRPALRVADPRTVFTGDGPT